MTRLGELLLAGIRLLELETTPGPSRCKIGRQQARTSLRLIREAFETRASWTPTELRGHLNLTTYQTKTALQRLATDGYLVVSGKTRAATYVLASAGSSQADIKRSA